MEEFFPPGVLEKGELAPESVKTGTVFFIKCISSNLTGMSYGTN